MHITLYKQTAQHNILGYTKKSTGGVERQRESGRLGQGIYCGCHGKELGRQGEQVYDWLDPIRSVVYGYQWSVVPIG